MDEFKVGDRVFSIVNSPDDNSYISFGSTGTVCHVYFEDYAPIGVRWDKDVRGHDCDGYCETGHGWRVYPNCIEHELSDEPLEYDEEEFNELISLYQRKV